MVRIHVGLRSAAGVRITKNSALGLIHPGHPGVWSDMAKAMVDPEELRRFALDLKRFVQTLEQQTGAMNARMANLGQTWRDQEHDKFAEQFDSTMKVLTRFTNTAGEHVPVLLRKAEKIEEYLNQR